MSLELVILWLASISTAQILAKVPQLHYADKTIEAEAISTVLQSTSENHIILLIQDQNYSRISLLHHLRASRGIGLFEMAPHGLDSNSTHMQLISFIQKAQVVATTVTEVLVLVASDDPGFLAVFAQWSVKGGLMVWANRLLVFTRLHIQNVQHLHETLSMTNSLLLKPTKNNERIEATVVYPYSDPGVESLVVAVWMAGSGLRATQGLQLFPEKFIRLKNMPNLLVAMIEDAMHRMFIHEDPGSPGGKRVTFEGYMVDVMNYVANGVNFSYSFIPSPDNSYGNKREDGTWTGMVGQVHREEVDIGLGPFTVTTDRARAVDFTYPVEVTSARILAGQKRLQVDPWGFTLPLSPEVWLATFISVVILPGTVCLLMFLFIDNKEKFSQWNKQQFGYLMILLQETITIEEKLWWWERLVLGVWLVITLVLTRSYEGNLMSLLAVRHIPQPYQSLRTVLDDPSVTMIWKKQGSFVELIKTSQSGIFREVMDTEKEGRLRFLSVTDYLAALDKDVIQGNQVIIDFAFNLIPINGNYFSVTGKCNFYIGRERLIAQSLGMIARSGSPIVPAITKRIMAMIEAGLYSHWYIQGIPNATSCDAVSSKVTVLTSFSLSNTWAMFAMLVAGLGVSFASLILECFISFFRMFYFKG